MHSVSVLRSLFARARALAWFTAASLAIVLGGCGSGSSAGSGAGSDGQVMVGFTDAEGDFLSYSVTVESLKLTKANGALIETLPLATTVDFAQYVEMTEFVTGATIPAGAYTGATIRLNYGAADIQVEDAAGSAVAVAPVDANGVPLTGTLELAIQFDAGRPLVVVPGVPAHLTIDFNLKASNEVDLSNGTVMVQPFLVADVDPQDVKIHRVRGPLQRVDIARSSFELRIRPFHRLVGDFGSLTVATDGNTAFEINGSVYQGAAGLAELALQPTFTATVAVGELSTTTRRFQAQEVYAGSSVAFGTADAITGNITARSGDTLTVRGATLARADGSVIFRDNVTVLVDGATKVVKQVSVETGLDKDSLSIGQRVRVFGTLSGAVGSQQLDARGSQGLARMLLTTLTGTVNATGAGEAQLALQTIDGRRVALFDFTGTGSSENADPAHYQVATGALSLSGLTNGTPVRVRGHVRPFGAAPADFTAQTLVNVVSLPAELGYGWDPAASAPFLSSSATQIVLSTTGVGGLHHVLRGGVATDLVTAPNAPSLVPTASLGLYAIGYQGTIEIHTTFDAYRQALDARLAASQKARFLGAYGHFDDATTTLAAGRALAAFE